MITMTFKRTFSILLFLACTGAGTAFALERPGPLVSTAWLAEHQDEVVILDVRMEPRSFGTPFSKADSAVFAATPLQGVMGHIPGAVAIPWKPLFGKRTEGGVELIGMRPPAGRFSALMHQAGVNRDSLVIVTGRFADIKDLAAAARLYWTLRYYGHDKVALLDGGVAQWAREKRPLEYEARTPKVGNFEIRSENTDLLANLEDVKQALDSGDTQVLDARALDLYLGLTYNRMFVPPSAKGHIAGARAFPAKLVADRMGPAVFYPAEEIRAAARAMGVDPNGPSITYCNSGVLCSLTWFALHELLENPNVRVFDGAMHQWSKDPDRSITRFRLE